MQFADHHQRLKVPGGWWLIDAAFEANPDGLIVRHSVPLPPPPAALSVVPSSVKPVPSVIFRVAAIRCGASPAAAPR